MMHYGPRNTPIDFDLYRSKVRVTAAKGQGYRGHLCTRTWVTDDIFEVTSYNLTKFTAAIFAPELGFPDNIFEVTSYNFNKFTAAIFVPFLHPNLGFRMISSKSLQRISPNLQEWCIMGQRRPIDFVLHRWKVKVACSYFQAGFASKTWPDAAAINCLSVALVYVYCDYSSCSFPSMRKNT